MITFTRQKAVELQKTINQNIWDGNREFTVMEELIRLLKGQLLRGHSEFRLIKYVPEDENESKLPPRWCAWSEFNPTFEFTKKDIQSIVKAFQNLGYTVKWVKKGGEKVVITWE